MHAHTPVQQSLVQRHMRTVIIVFAVVVAINIAVMSRFFISKKPAKLNPLWDYVSANVQQAVLVQSDVLLTLLGDNLSTISNNPLYSTLINSNHIGILQFGSGLINQSSAILIDAKKSFSTNEFLSSINMEDDTDYSFHRYSDSVYVFAQPSTIDMMLADDHIRLSTSERFAVIKPLVAGGHINFLSRVNPDATLDQTVSEFVAQTDMFVLSLRGMRKSLALDAHLLYTEPKTQEARIQFAPRMTRYIDDQTIAYIETTLDGLWSQEEQGTLIDALRAYDPALFETLSDEQIGDLVENNVGLVLQNSPNFSDLRLALLLNSPAAHTIFRSIFPSLQEPLAALAGIDPRLLPAVEENNRVSYQTTLFGLVPLTLQSYIDNDNTVLSLGAASALASPNTHKPSVLPAGSIGYVFVQFDPFLQLYRQITTMMGQVQDPFSVQQEQLLQGKTWAGYLSVDSDKVSLWSEIR